jgi:cell division protein FtsB
MEPDTPLRPPTNVSSDGAGGSEPAPTAPDLSSLPIAGITRRRIAFLAGAFLTAWLVIVFARQVAAANAATNRVEDAVAANSALESRVAALQRESELIQRQKWIVQQARGHGLGDPGEIPFALGDAPSLPPHAPGSAAVRLGAEVEPPSPLESWLSLLFGPSR